MKLIIRDLEMLENFTRNLLPFSGDNVINLKEEFKYEDNHHVSLEPEIVKTRFSEYDINEDGGVTREELIYAIVSADINSKSFISK